MITPEGDYLSNLRAPDLRPYFKHLHWRVMPHSMGHLVASDWADKADDDTVFGLYKNCGLWTRDEAAILYNAVFAAVRIDGRRRREWLDIGAHTGWTTQHIALAGADACAVDPIWGTDEENAFHYRFYHENMRWMLPWGSVARAPISFGLTSLEFFKRARHDCYLGACIDGDHSEGKPLEDAKNAAQHLADTGVILFHDFIGRPVREAVTWLMDHGFKARVYYTPHMVACCWRGDFTPPVHERDERINWAPHISDMSKDFDFKRCE